MKLFIVMLSLDEEILAWVGKHVPTIDELATEFMRELPNKREELVRVLRQDLPNLDEAFPHVILGRCLRKTVGPTTYTLMVKEIP